MKCTGISRACTCKLISHWTTKRKASKPGHEINMPNNTTVNKKTNVQNCQPRLGKGFDQTEKKRETSYSTHSNLGLMLRSQRVKPHRKLKIVKHVYGTVIKWGKPESATSLQVESWMRIMWNIPVRKGTKMSQGSIKRLCKFSPGHWKCTCMSLCSWA
jgi:hypothetical protein